MAAVSLTSVCGQTAFSAELPLAQLILQQVLSRRSSQPWLGRYGFGGEVRAICPPRGHSTYAPVYSEFRNRKTKSAYVNAGVY